ncbi:tetratricopeptide repeat protein [Novosphingobium mangrovi (ex Huang et al. 2023)]|uniref:Tetratricopeptide repeat protein n=1 Tax=Novosphingobium mangrovi (ex Huang et al. 2023) TaxID=2976432 RepID=A0ABT2I5F6_9SPHN|nr:tetratricopeptide repeat protein [Novosphingobium mangrovi (ex Huang et al. 2023)]MCT2400049.1 tetratricopeptide repeat protein [Novosphingobium mangrovi (ex Huang et al. 2023)]
MPLALLSSPGFGERPTAEAAIEAARAALARGDGIDGEMKLRVALDNGASRRDVAAWMGRAYLEQDNRDKAREWLAPGNFSPAGAADGWRALGLLERLDGDLEASTRAYGKALEITPNDASLWVEVGRMRYVGGEHRLAIEAAKHALSLDPGNVRALEFRGQMVRDRYGLLAAVPWFEQALLQDPRDVSVLLEYAATLGDLGRASEALTVTRRVLELAPGNARAYYLQAVIAARAGNYDLARGLLMRTKGELDWQPGVQMLHGVVEIAKGNPSAAAEALEAVLRAKPDSMRARELLARAIYLAGQYRYATLRFAGDIAREDASPYLLTVVARSYEVLGERQKAGELLDRAARTPRPALHVVPGQGRIGEMLAHGQAGAAQAVAESDVREDPGFYDNQALAGDVQLALGHPVAAQEHYAAAAEIRMPASLFRRRFEAYVMAGDLKGGKDLVEGYLRQNPTSRPALRAAARLAIGTGDMPRASAILTWLRDTGDARDVQLLCDLAMVQAGEGDIEGARGSALAAYRLQRASPLATQALGYSYAMLGDRAEAARALLDKAEAMVGSTPLIAQARRQLRSRQPA